MAEPYEAWQEWERLGYGHGDVPEALEPPMWMGTGPSGVCSLSLMVGFCTRSSGGPLSVALAGACSGIATGVARIRVTGDRLSREVGPLRLRGLPRAAHIRKAR